MSVERLKQDEQLLPILRKVTEQKYHTNLRHGAVEGGHPYLGFKDGQLTYISIMGVFMSREISDDVLMTFISYDKDKKLYSTRYVEEQKYMNKSTKKAKNILDNGFAGMRITDEAFMFLMYYIRKQCNNIEDFREVFPVKRRMQTTRTVYITPRLADEVDKKVRELNAK
jgi:hypothetical protein